MGSKMNRPRWGVEATCWMPPEKRWRVTRYNPGGTGTVLARFPTHREALDYADRMARTVTITLPRTNPPHPTTVKYIVAANHKADDYHATILEYVHE